MTTNNLVLETLHHAQPVHAKAHLKMKSRGMFYRALGAICVALGSTAAQARDGSHDFDFSVGLWHVEIHRTPNPFASPGESYGMSGSINVRPFWSGKGHIEEMEVDGPKGHWEGLNLFLYNPSSEQWSKTYAASRTGQTEPPLIGSFANGVGEFYSPDTLGGRAILTRARFFNVTEASYHYDEAYSINGGRSWLTAFDAQITKLPANKL